MLPGLLIVLLLPLRYGRASAADQTGERIAVAGFAQNYRDVGPPPRGQASIAMALPLRIRAPLHHGQVLERWFRIGFHLSARAQAACAVYLPYVSPDAAVYLNGVYLGASDGFSNSNSESWNYPLYFPLPGALLRTGRNELWVESRSYLSGITELGPIWIGPQSSLYRRYQRQLWLQVIGVEVVSLLVGVIGLFAFLLWWRRRSEAIFGLFALSCAIWIVRNTQFFLVHTLISPFHYAVISDASLFWLVAVLFTLGFRIAGTRFARSEWGMYGYAAAATLAMWFAGAAHKWTVTAAFYAMIFPGSTIFILFLSRLAWQRKNVLLSLLWLAAVVTSVSGAYDFLLMAEWVPWPGAYLMPYSALFFAGTVGWALVDQFVLAHTRYERLNAELEARVQVREAELARQYQRAAELGREHAIRIERERILRDMHDGLGLQLISSIRLIEKQELSRAQMAELLSEAMDELRIAIDSVKPAAQDLLVMLGNLRYRIEPRLHAAGLSLAWDIGGISGLENLLPNQVTEITRIVQEAFTNVLKHADASQLGLHVHATAGPIIEITITDNGRGFDAAACAQGEGLTNMRRRARKIGAALWIESRPGATRVCVTVR